MNKLIVSIKPDKVSYYEWLFPKLPKNEFLVQDSILDEKYIISEGDYIGKYLWKSDTTIIEEKPTKQSEGTIKYDEGKREFTSGAKRDNNSNKIRPDLISPHMLKALGKVLQEGAAHYGERNWEKGLPDNVLKESAGRHYVSWMNNELDEDHAAKLIFNVMAFIHNRDKV